MKSYKIKAGATESIYKADSQEAALEMYAEEAGYKSYADVVAEYGEVDSIVSIFIKIKDIRTLKEDVAGIGGSSYATSSDYTILDDDGYDMILVTTGAATKTITLPTAAYNVDRVIEIMIEEIAKRYAVRDREGGNIMEEYDTIEEAKECIRIFEQEDSEEDIYEERFYEVYDKIKEKIVQ